MIKEALLIAGWIGLVQAYDEFARMDRRIAITASTPPTNDAVTQLTIKSTICAHGWTRTVRPPVSYTNAIKGQMLLNRGESLDRERLYELDHIVPLELGGAPADIRNLQLQLWPEAREKDQIENCLKDTVCQNALSLDEARRMIWEDWREAKAHCAPGTWHQHYEHYVPGNLPSISN